MLDKWRGDSDEKTKLEALTHQLSRPGNRITGGVVNAANDIGVTRFDYQEPVTPDIVQQVRDTGLKATVWLNHLWVSK